MDMQLGRYADRVVARLHEWDEQELCRRIWEKDPTVWFPDPRPEIVDRLGWLTLPETMAGHIADLEAFAEGVRDDGIRHVVLLGMGGSSLAPEVYQRTLGSAEGYPSLFVLDSTHPDAVRDMDERIDIGSTLFVVASKSGGTLETLSGFRYYWQRASRALGKAGQRFVAITDPGTALESLAREREFRAVFPAPTDVGGRYSALTMFGLVPAALIGADLERLRLSAAAMAELVGPGVPPSVNHAFQLGAAMGELALAGRDKLTYLVSPSLAAFPDWIEQLVAESTGKDDKGIIPIAGEPIGPIDVCGNDRVFVVMHVATEPAPGIDDLVEAGHPVVTLSLASVYDLGGEMFRAELATAAAGAALGIHPFNQPDVQLAKKLALEAMESDRSAVQNIEALRVDDPAFDKDLRAFLGAVHNSEYVAFQAYLPRRAENEAILGRLRVRTRAGTKAATTVGFGPRFLHSTGQLHKGGPNKGVFVQIIDHPVEDIEVPEAGYTFGTIIRAQADGDYRALTGRGRRVLRIDLGVAGLEALENQWPM